MSKHIKVSISVEVMERLLEGDAKAHGVAWSAAKVARIKEELFRARVEEERAIREYEVEQGRQRDPITPEGEDLSAPMAPEGAYVPSTGTRSPRRARKGVRVPTVPINPPSPLRDPWKAPQGPEVSDVEPEKGETEDEYNWCLEYEVNIPYDVEPELPMTDLGEPTNQPECKGREANNWDACHMPLTRPVCVPPRLTLDRPCGCWMGVVLFNPALGETILMKACGVLETVPAVNWVFARSEREFDGCGA